MEDLLTIKELSEKLKISEVSIYRLVNKGMPRIKIGGSIRFQYEEVMKWIKENGDNYGRKENVQ